MISVFLPVFVIAVIVFQYFLRKSNGSNEKYEEFLENERLANSVRKKDIDEKIYIKPELSRLPIKDYSVDEKNNLFLAQEAVVAKASRKMVKLQKPMTNTELKFEYGVSNLDNITNMEENFNDFMRSLIQWAEVLIQNNNRADAEQVLNYAIFLGCEFSKAYQLLIDLYVNNNDQKKLLDLHVWLSDVNTLAYNIHLKNKILNSMEKHLTQNI